LRQAVVATATIGRAARRHPGPSGTGRWPGRKSAFVPEPAGTRNAGI